MITVKGALAAASALLKSAGIAEPYREAQLLLAHVLNADIIWLITRADNPLQSRKLKAFKAAVIRRMSHCPLAYIVGKRSFMNWDFTVSPSVLIPRPCTEILVETTAIELQSRFGGSKLQIADIGTGSGAIGLSLLLLLPSSYLHAVDISQDALKIATENARNLGVARRAVFYRGDSVLPLAHLQGRLHGIVANLPYISNRDYLHLNRDVLAYEPQQALRAGADGLSYYRPFLAGVGKLLRPGGICAIEIGHRQARRVMRLFYRAGFFAPEVVKDLAGLDRIVWAAK